MSDHPPSIPNFGNSPRPLRIDLADESLFGRLAGEDEREDVLVSYFHQTRSFERFNNSEARLRIIRGDKGTGKSAFLHYCRLSRSNDRTLHIIPSDFAARRENESTNDYWTSRLLLSIGEWLGASTALALGSDEARIVELAERTGAKKQNLVGRALGAVKSFKIAGVEFSLDSNEDIRATRAAVKRILEKREALWVFIDDVDAKFINDQAHRELTGGFYDTCRRLSRDLNVRIRTTARASVWRCIAEVDPEKDKFRQDLVDIDWVRRKEDIRAVILKRIWAYLRRTQPGAIPEGLNENSRNLFDLVFSEQDLPWRKSRSPIDRVLATLSSWRPRWVIRLCQLMSEEAVKLKETRISDRAHTMALGPFSTEKLQDLCTEYSHEHSSLRPLVYAFQRGPRGYAWLALLEKIKKVVVSQGGALPSGEEARSGVEGIAAFLYRIGFLVIEDKNVYFRYGECPDEFYADKTNRRFEVDSVFRQALKIR